MRTLLGVLILMGAYTAGHAQQAAPPPKAIPAPADVAAPPKDAERTPVADGGQRHDLRSKVIRAGRADGLKAAGDDKVEVHYTGWTTDGKMFDSSLTRGRTATFPLKAVIPGFKVGCELMVEGEIRRLWIPEALAYKGRPGAPQGMLVFDVELVRVHPAPRPQPVPAGFKADAPPKGASKSPSGLAYVVLSSGEGKKKPPAGATVSFHMSHWAADGTMTFTSVGGPPRSLELGGAAAGDPVREALADMTIGEKRLIWTAFGGDAALIYVVLVGISAPPAPPPAQPKS